jgi:acyl-CoA thioesterase II
MAGFVRATSVVADGAICAASIDSDWFIWGPFGGYLAALSLRAMAACSAHKRPATFSCQFLNVGRPGPITIAVERVKQGRKAECLRASVKQDGVPLVEAQAWIVAAAFSGLEHCDTAPPDAEKPCELSDWHGVGEEEKSPVWGHVARRPLPCFRTSGQAKMRARWACWLRLNEEFPEGDAGLAAARAVLWMDLAPWNAALNMHGRPTTHLAPTLDLTVQFQPHLYAAEADGCDWMLVETASPVAGHGLYGAHSKLWSETGRLVAVGAAQGICVPNPRYAAFNSPGDPAGGT